MRPPTLKMLEWLHLLEVKPGSTRRTNNIAYRCMQRGWAEWNYVNAKGDNLTLAEARERYGEKYWGHVHIEGERLTNAGRAILAKNLEVTMDDYDNSAKGARDEAIERVSDESWMDDAFNVLLGCVEVGWEGTGEEIREMLTGRGLRDPHHHNCWGAFIMDMLRRKYLTKTGVYVNMHTVKSHARATPVLRWLG